MFKGQYFESAPQTALSSPFTVKKGEQIVSVQLLHHMHILLCYFESKLRKSLLDSKSWHLFTFIPLCKL